MRKLKRIFTSFLAVALVLSNLSVAGITVNAAELDSEIVMAEEDVSGNEPGEDVSGNEPGEGGDVSGNEPGEGGDVSGNEPGEGGDVSGNEPGEGGDVSGNEPGDDVSKMDVITYTFDDFVITSMGPEYKLNDDGSISVSAEGQYASVFFELPAELNERTIKKITFNVTSDTASTWGYKAFMKDGFESAMWGDGVTPTEENKYAPYGNPVQEIPEDYQVGLGHLALTSTAENVTIDVSSVSFECVPEGPVDRTYTFNDFVITSMGPEYKLNDDGSISVSAEGQYASVFFELPAELNNMTIQKITFNVTSDTASTWGYKAFMKEGFESAMWGDGVTPTEENKYAPYGNPVQEIPEDYQVGLGHLALTSTAENVTIDVASVTFTCIGGGNKPQISYGDNIIKNPYFAEEDLSMWTIGTNKSTIKSVSGNAVEDIETYGVIDRDASWLEGTVDARHEYFAQDITAAIAEGGDLNRRPEYKVEFWVKLSDDYKDAPAEQRKVEFAPYIETEQGDKEYLGPTYSTQLSGDLSKTLEPGVWTKFSGTFKVSHSGAINKVLIRIVEQGTAYGVIADGSECVKGDYYVTGVSMTEVFKPKTEIETDIPNWKDAITGAFGDDAIAGTCLGSGTITYDYLQDLAKKHFNAITFENEMKPDITLGQSPNLDEDGKPIYNFSVADRMMAQIKAWNDLDLNDDINFKIRGHVLVWHSQTPEWFFHTDYDVNKPFASKDEMNEHLEHYIAGVFNHYKNVEFKDGTTAADMFYGWDVVNEAMSDNTGKPRMAAENSNWARVYGDQSNEYIINAFRYANEYAPEKIELYYNDYNDSNAQKAKGIAQLIKDIRAAEGTRIDGMGMQAHHNYGDPSASQIRAAIDMYLEALGEGGTVQMTEFDVKASQGYDGSAASLKEEHAKQAWRFKEIFDVYREVNNEKPGSVGGITMWGITDETSWLQSSNSVGGASQGGTHAPLLFAVDQKNYLAYAKPAFYAFFEEYLDTLEPMIQDVTVMEQGEEGDFGIAATYKVSDVAEFSPMWTEEGLVVKVSVTDATPSVSGNDFFEIYYDDGEIKSVKVERSEENSTETGYTDTVKIPMATGAGVKVKLDVVVSDGSKVYVFNDKKFGYAESSQYYAQAIMKPYTVIQMGSVVVDAEADAAWDNVKAIPLSIVRQSPKAEATIKTLWDPEYLYVYAEVVDPELDDTGAQVHEKDSVEVFIDENNAKAGGYEADDKQYRVTYNNEQTFNGEKCIAENIKSATRITENGYIVEAAYKWTDIVPEDGIEIGLELQINDAEGGTRIGTASWFDTTDNCWQSPAVFGTARLAGSEFYIMPIADYEYTGKNIVPEVAVYYGSKKLVKGEDYTVAVTSDNKKKVGPATVTVTGVKNFKDSVVDVDFNIVKKNLASEDIKIADIAATAKADGTVVTPKVVVKYGNAKLKEGVDYTIKWPEIKKDADGKAISETYDVVIVAVEDTDDAKCNYTGSKTIQYKVTANTDVAINNNKVKVSVAPISYTEYATGVKPAVTVTYNGEAVAESAFEVVYPDAVSLGNKNVVTINAVEGEGFFGTRTAKFDVTGTKLSADKFEIAEIAPVTYTGKAITPAVTVVDNTSETPYAMVEGRDFTVSYAKNTNAGNAKVTIKGIGAYSGTLNTKFAISKLDGTGAAVTVKAQEYTGKVVKPEVKVVVNGNELTKADYTVSYKNNKNVGTASVTVAFNNKNVTGKASASFDITKKALDASMVNGPYLATIKNNKVSNPNVVVKFAGKALAKNKDYAVEYPEIAKDAEGNLVAGDYVVTIKAVADTDSKVCNFKGSVNVPFKVLAANTVQMSKVTIKVAPKTVVALDYTKPAVTVKYQNKDITDKVYISYPDTVTVGKNNVITVTAKGDSGFYGTKTAKFEATAVKLENKADKFEITGIDAKYTYTGKEIKPVVTIKDVVRDITLVEGKDYTVQYKNCVKAGVAKAEIKGIGNYTGKFTQKYTIEKAVMTFGERLSIFFGNMF